MALPARPIPRSPEVKAFLYDNAVIGETKRFRQINRYEAHYKCLQYQHLQQDWWGLPADQLETISSEVQVPFGFTQPALQVAVRAKRPTAPYNLVKATVDRFTGLLFSESRKPSIVVDGDPDTEAFLRAAMEQMLFWPKMRQARTMGGATGSVLVTVHVRNGEFSLEVHNPKHCMMVWKDRRTLTPMGVLKMYKYMVEEDVRDERTGEVTGTAEVAYLYRRIITEDDDTVFEPVKLEPGADLSWVPQSEVTHSLGFFPGAWIQNLSVIDDVDGDPDCHGGWQIVDTIDRLLSQMNKGVLLNLDPTLVLGVDPKVVEMQGGVRKGSDNALSVGPQGTAKYLEITGGGVEAGGKLYEILKKNFLDVVRCVLIDPDKISGSAQSAKAIEYIFAAMLEKADDLRAQYGDLGIIPLLKVVEAIARKSLDLGVTPEGAPIKGKFNLPPRVSRKAATTPDGEPETIVEEQKLGAGGYIRCKWGAYFQPTEEDSRQRINNAVAARADHLIDRATAIRHVASVFQIENPEAMEAKAKAEEAEELKQEEEAAAAGVKESDAVMAAGKGIF